MSSESQNESAQLFRQADPAELCEWTHTNRFLRHVPSAAVAPADLLQPIYWLRAANQLTQNDIIICIPADSSWWVELIVRDIGPEGVIVMPKGGAVFESIVAPPGASTQKVDSEASFYYAGPLLKWQVLGKDGRVLKSSLNSQSDAAAWLAEHRKMQARTSKGSK